MRLSKLFIFSVFLFSSFVLIAQQDVSLINQNLDLVLLEEIKLSNQQSINKQLAITEAIRNGWDTLNLIGLDKNGHPLYMLIDNEVAAQATRTDWLHSGGVGNIDIDGDGFTIGIWEAFENPGSFLPRTTHENLNNVIEGNSGTFSFHGSHVAGTLAGNGLFNADAKGMAPNADVHAFDIDQDITEMIDFAIDNNLVSNHSYGQGSGWVPMDGNFIFYGHIDEYNFGMEDSKFGKYNAGASQWDMIAVGAPNYLIVKAAGNDRNDNPNLGDLVRHVSQDDTQLTPYVGTHPQGDGATLGGYDCLPPIGTAKNILTVGAINWNSGGNDMTTFSSWGPTDDGRVKPDIVGHGQSLESCAEDSDNDYGISSGTSMSSPNVAGSAVLLQEYFEDLNGSGNYMTSAALKGLIIHTAEDLEQPGPDYRTGWGLMDTYEAALFLEDDIDGKSRIIEGTILENGTYSIGLPIDQSEPLKITLVWTDPAGTPNSGGIDDDEIALINDLNLAASSTSMTHYPYTLDPTNPNSAASTGVNFRDNVEQIYVLNPESNWFDIEVSHLGPLENGSQDFALIISKIDCCNINQQASGSITSCSGSSEFFIDVAIVANSGSGDFNIEDDHSSTSYDVFGVSEGNYQLGPYPNGTIVQVTIFDNDSGCNFTQQNLTENCLPSCDIQVTQIVTSCTNEQFYSATVVYSGTSGQEYDLTTNYGFSIDDLPANGQFVLPDIPSGTQISFTLTDTANGSCFVTASPSVEECSLCNLQIIEASATCINGSQYEVEIEFVGDPGHTYDLFASPPQGSSSLNGVSPGTYTFSTFNENQNTTIWIEDESDPTNCNTSYFIDAPNCLNNSITVNWPISAGDCTEPGTNQTITWSITGSIGLVTIEYCEVGGSCLAIVENISNSGSYNWTVPADYGNHQIKIYEIGGPVDYGNTFEISSDCGGSCDNIDVTLISPANNYTTIAGETINFQWNGENFGSCNCCLDDYYFQIDDNPSFSSPTEIPDYSLFFYESPISQPGVYYWRVRAQNNLGDFSNWSAVHTINVVEASSNLLLELASCISYPDPICSGQTATFTISFYNPNNQAYFGEIVLGLTSNQDDSDDTQIITIDDVFIPGNGTVTLSFTDVITVAPTSSIKIIIGEIDDGLTLSDMQLVLDGVCENAIEVSIIDCDCTAPTNLTEINLNNTEATLTWDNVPDANSYTLYWYEYPSGILNSIPISAGDNDYNLDDLDPGTTYCWEVVSNCDSGGFTSVERCFVTTSSTCVPPGGLFTSVIYDEQAIFNWNDPNATDPDSYQMRYREIGSSSWIQLNVLIGAAGGIYDYSYIFSNLDFCTDYEWQVRKYCDAFGVNSAWSYAVSFTSDCNTTVGDFYVENITLSSSSVEQGNSVLLEFEQHYDGYVPVNLFSHYEVYLSQDLIPTPDEEVDSGVSSLKISDPIELEDENVYVDIDVESGIYNLIICVDIFEAHDEDDESNNCSAILLQVGAVGCTDLTSHNYDPSADYDDGTCETCYDGVLNGDEEAIDCGGALCIPCNPICSSYFFEVASINSTSIGFTTCTDDIDIDSDNIKVWSRQLGILEGSIQVFSGDYMEFQPAEDFLYGDELMITIHDVQDNGGNPYPNYNFQVLVPTGIGPATFDTVYTGITLPFEAMNNSYQYDNADFNRDGLSDVVFRYHSAYGNPTVLLVYLQQASGGYTLDTYTHNYSHSNLRETPDLNNDGYPDLVVSHNVPSRAHVRLNNGDGTFGAPVFYTVSNYSNGITFGDIDGDGDIDMINYTGIASLAQNKIEILRNNGNGTFAPAEAINTGIFGRGLELGDFDNDGDLDMAYMSSNSFGSQMKYRIYENNGAGFFSLVIDEFMPVYNVVYEMVDLNADGFNDILFALPSTKVIYGTGVLLDYSMSNAVELESTDRRYLVGDLNGDNTLDFFFNKTSNGIDLVSLPYETFLNDGSSYQLNEGQIVLKNVISRDLSDLDKDGDLDLMYVTDDRRIMYVYNKDLCPTDLTIDDVQDPIYQSSATISTSGQVIIPNGTSVEFRSNEINLNALFETQLGAELLIEIDPCNN